MKKRIRNMIVSVMAAGIFLGSSGITAFAGSQNLSYTASTSGTTNKIAVKSVELDTDDDSYQNEIELNLSTRVNWKNTAKVTSVTDGQGTSYSAKITDKDSDECDIYIASLKKGRTYTIKINGIKKAGTSGYRTLTVKVTVPAPAASSSGSKPVVQEVSCDFNDDGDNEKDAVSIEFTKKVTFKSGAYVIITDASGKQISTKNSYVEFDSDECEVSVNANLKNGKKYQYKVVGVKLRGATGYKTVSGSFTAYND